MGFRLVGFRCTAGRVCPESMHVAGKQPWGSRLVFCTCAGTEAWAGYLCGSWASSGVDLGKGSQERLWRLESTNVNICGTKPDEICSGSSVVVLALGVFSGESCWSSL